VPTPSVDFANVAVLLSPLPVASTALPNVVPPLINVTVPVGATYPLVTVAVNVTAWPALEGFSEEASVVVVLAALITWLSAEEVEAPKFPVAAYTTVIESVPSGRLEVVSVAVLLVPLPAVKVAVPIAVAPFMNVTEPVGAADPLETVAVNVTACPKLAGLTEEATVDVVPAAFTTSLSAEEVEAPKLPVAAYTAVIELVPTARLEVVIVAVLLVPLPAVNVALPIVVVPLLKITVPVGAALLLDTVAVNVTACPALAGFSEDATVDVVAAVPTDSDNTGEVEPLKFPVPP
jgi:hypothetical protein